MTSFLKYRKLYFIISGLLVAASIFSLLVFSLNPGIDFTGGSILELEYSAERPSNEVIKNQLSSFDLGEVYIQPTGEKGIILRTEDITEDVHQDIVAKLKEASQLQELRFESIGPVIGQELREKTRLVAILSLLAIVAYIAFAFRRLSWPARSWEYGLAALIALFHDVLIPIGIFSVLGEMFGVQITIPVVVALLTVVGYSINDTVVVFDRIRENLTKKTEGSYEEKVDLSIGQTLTRSFHASLTTLFVLIAIFLFGGESLRYFALALILGIVVGTYSSLFLAGPLLITWLRWRRRI